MARKPTDLPDEVKDAVVRDYQAGAKTVVIQWEHKVTPGTMYRILHAAKIRLRVNSHKPELPLRPKCGCCGRDYDPGLRKDGQPDRRETMCWICSGWATEFRGPREVYNQDGTKVISRERR